MQYGRAAWVMLVAACGGSTPVHVKIPAPPAAEMPAASRVAWFNALQPEVARVETTWQCERGGGCATTRQDTFLTLGNGTVVEAAEDLLPVLPPDSETARHIAARDRARAKADRYSMLGGMGFVLSLGLLLSAHDSQDELDGTRAAIGLGTALAGVVFWGIAHDHRMTSFAENRAAFSSYARDLATRLRICVNGLQVMACQDGPPGAP